jgi:HEAT repeat protein
VRTLLAVVAATILLAGCGRDAGPKELYFSGEPVTHWLSAARSPDPKVRKKAIDVLGNVGPADPAAIPALAEAVRDKDPAVRDAAVLALSKIGKPAAAALPALRDATKDANLSVRTHAITAVERVGGT